MPLTTCILFRNHRETIAQAIQSIKPLGGKIIAGDIGSSDNSSLIVKKLGATVIPLPFKDDYSECKNTLMTHSTTDMVFFIDPWENLVSGHDELTQITKGSHVQNVMNGNVVTKQVRLFSRSSGNKFDNPIYETTSLNNCEFTDAVIYSKEPADNGEKLKIVEKWRAKRPTFADPIYYHSNILLSQGKYTEFLDMAHHYLFLENSGIASVMTNYHIAMVKLYSMNETKDSLNRILACIAINPLMAEFWCLLGDLYYKTKLYEKAEVFYDNALKLGARRPKHDLWPLSLASYSSHPEKMIKSARHIRKESQKFQTISKSDQAH